MDKSEPGYPDWMVGGGCADPEFQDTEDPYGETGHNALFEGHDGKLWSSCHYLMYVKRPCPYCSDLLIWETTPQMGIEPVSYEGRVFSIRGPIWTEQVIK